MLLTVTLNVAALLAVLFGVPLLHRNRHHLSVGRSERALSFSIFVSVFLSLCLVVGVGPQIQHYLVAAISSSEANLYATANPAGLTWFPDLWTWIWMSSISTTNIAAAAITLVATSATTTRELFLRTTVVALFSLLANDFLIGLTTNQFDGSYIWQNLFGDILGAILISGLLLLQFRLIDLTLVSTTTSPKLAALAAILVPLLIGLGTNASTYYGFLAIYNPTDTRVEFGAVPPYSGMYWPAQKPFAPNAPRFERIEAQPFGIFSAASPDTVPIDFTYVSSPVRAVWQATSLVEPSRVELLLYANCGADKLGFLTTSKPVWVSSLARRLEISLGVGVGTISANTRRNGSSRIFVAAPSNGTQFWVERSSKSDALDLIRFLPDKSVLHYWATNGDVDFSIDSILFDETSSGDLKLQSRVIKLRLDDRTLTLLVEPLPGSQRAINSTCHTISTNRLFDKKSAKIQVHEAQFGVAVRITRDRQPAMYSDSERDAVTIEASGQISVRELTPNSLQQFVSNGHVDAAIIQRGVSRIVLDDEALHSEPTDNFFFARSDLYVAVTEDASLRIEGTTGALFRNHSRLTRTRWEKLGFSVQTLMLTILTFVLTPLLTVVGVLLRRNTIFYWTSI